MERDIHDDVSDFHKKFGHPAPDAPHLPSLELMSFRKKLLREECEELCDAIDARDPGSIASEAVDLIYVAIGTLVMCGLKFAPFWKLVQKANMAKIPNPNGGKPLKPTGWRKPDCGALVPKWYDDELEDFWENK